MPWLLPIQLLLSWTMIRLKLEAAALLAFVERFQGEEALLLITKSASQVTQRTGSY